jgi:hypothetical protein
VAAPVELWQSTGAQVVLFVVYRTQRYIIQESHLKLAETFAVICTAVLFQLFASAANAQQTGPQPSPASKQATAHADPATLMRAGHFAEAERIYLHAIAQDPHNFTALAQLAQIALLANRLDDADKWLVKAHAANPGNAGVKIMQAEVLYRRNQFPAAAAALDGVNPNDPALKPYSTLNVKKLAAFQGLTPYEVSGAGEVTHVKFVTTVALPVINVRINGGREVSMFIDTGGSELLLDSDFAKEIGVQTLGSVDGTFSGGQQAPVGNGKIDSLTLGDWTVKNVPVAMIPLRPLSQPLGVKELDGCVGTNVLYQFLATMDYPAGQLTLRRKTPETEKAFHLALAKTAASLPMWLQGDHFMVAWGRIDKMPPALFFVDSGLEGAGIKLSMDAIHAAGLKLDESKASKGEGGAGSFTTTPFNVPHFAMSAISATDLSGVYDGPLLWSEGWPFTTPGMVGDYFLKPYRVTYDFPAMRIIFEKP